MRDEMEKMRQRQTRIARGAAAESAKHYLENTFTDVKDIVVRQLVENTRESGEADTYSVFLLTALHDMRQRIQEHIDAGRSAQKALAKDIERKKSERNAGGSEA